MPHHFTATFTTMKTLSLTRPDDFHLHVRDGALLTMVIAHSAKQFARAMIMPNLKPPIVTVQQAECYHQEILTALPPEATFKPLMSLYLTEATSIDEIKKAAHSDVVYAFKLYPAGATTHSDLGVKNITSIYPLFAEMEKQDIPLLIHGEVTDEKYDIFDRERVFIERYLVDVHQQFPALRIVLEHLTTAEAVQFVSAANSQVAATITPQHLLYNRNALFSGGIRPHYYCLPILKREEHRLALVNAATSGNPKFFLGTDSAPHTQTMKENTCGCAGCYSAFGALELYAEAFERAEALDKLEGFASFYGADFYHLPRNTDTITLVKSAWQVPDNYSNNEINIVPLAAGSTLQWRQS